MYSSIRESSSLPGESAWLASSSKRVIKTEQPAFNLWVKRVIMKKKKIGFEEFQAEAVSTVIQPKKHPHTSLCVYHELTQQEGLPTCL